MKKILALAVWIAALGLYAHPATTGWIYSRRTRSLWKRCPFRSESPLVKPLKSAARSCGRRYDGARYTIRYFQPDGRGELRMDDGTVFLPNDRYPLDQTAEVCRFAIKKSAFNIEFVPEAMKTPELCLAAAGHRGETLKFVPDRLKTPKMCRAAVDSNSYALYYVPEGLKPPELCMTAVKRNGLVLEAVPGELRTPQICRAALKAVDSADYKILPYIPYPDICLEGLKKFDVVRGQVRDFRLHCPGGHDRGAGPSRRRGDGRVLPFARAGGTAHGGSLPACRQRGRHPCSMKCRRNYARNGSAAGRRVLELPGTEYVPKHLKNRPSVRDGAERDPLAIRFFNP